MLAYTYRFFLPAPHFSDSPDSPGSWLNFLLCLLGDDRDDSSQTRNYLYNASFCEEGSTPASDKNATDSPERFYITHLSLQSAVGYYESCRDRDHAEEFAARERVNRRLRHLHATISWPTCTLDLPSAENLKSSDTSRTGPLMHHTAVHHTAQHLAETCAEQLQEYLQGKRSDFSSLPLLPLGTKFQDLAWQYLWHLGYGKTASYQQQALACGGKQFCRAAGNANRSNPIILLLPCHRIVGKDGSLTGYLPGIQYKKYFLELEHCHAPRLYAAEGS